MASDELDPRTREVIRDHAGFITKQRDRGANGEWDAVWADIERLDVEQARALLLTTLMNDTGAERRHRAELWREYGERASAAAAN